MKLDLKGVSVLILGAGQGLGKSLCTVFSQEGAIVSVITRKEENLAVCETEIRNIEASSCGLFIQGNASNQEFLLNSIEKINARFGKIEIAICNIGPTCSGNWDEVTNSDWIESLQCNVYPFYFMCKYLMPKMKKDKKGSIIKIGSISAVRPGGISKPDHAFFKAGSIALIKRLSKDLAAYNIRVNMVSPGLIEPTIDENNNVGEMLCERLKIKDRNEAIEFYCNQKIPLKRPAKADEVAKVVAFISSPAASYITGQNIMVDGGYSI